MAELIDRRDIVFAHKVEGSEEYKEGFLDGAMCVLDAIDEMPTIEAKPVVHAHWEIEKYQAPFDDELQYKMTCSKCGYDYCSDEVYCLEYCARCGAQMDEPFSQDHEKGVKIPVISMKDVPKIMEEMEK